MTGGTAPRCSPARPASPKPLPDPWTTGGDYEANRTLTDTGTNPATNTVKVGNNLNHMVVLHGQNAVNQYRAEFDRLRSGTFGDLHERHEPRPSEFQLAKIRIKPVFAPEQGPR